MKQKSRKTGFSIIELLTVMSIIIVLLGILVPSLGAVRRYAKVVRQKGYFHDISKGLESFSVDFDGYPDSSAGDFDTPPDHYCGAMKLCEAMIGQDGMGFHPDSVFDDEGKAADGTTELYFNRVPLANPDNPSGAERQNLQARKPKYIEGEDVQIGSMKALYENNLVGTTGELDANCPVLCDVFKRNQLQVLGEKAGMPILYYKADTSKLLHEKDELQGPGTYNAGDNIYNYYDNYDLIFLGIPWSGAPHAYEDPAIPQRDDIFFNQTRDKNVRTMDKPHKPNSYILQSAGWDAKFGTDDDVFNFE